jgi:diketogulonate reductase-like aldo/keto reductase
MDGMKNTLLTRRRFNLHCAAMGLALPAFGAIAANETPSRTVKLPDGTSVPALGQGAWHLGQGRHPEADEEQAIRTGMALGMTLLDTSGNYGNGRSEQFLAKVLAGQRDRIFLVSKVEADEVSGDGISKACDASLARLGTDHIDLYLLHSPVSASLFAGVVAQFEKLRKGARIRAWGVSNFSTAEMEKLYAVPDGPRCATNQVAYSLGNRRIEKDLLPWCTSHNIPVMAYSPLGGDNSRLIGDPVLTQIGTAHGCSAAAVALAWSIRSGTVIAIPESGSAAHTKENAAALTVALTPEDIAKLSTAYPGPAGAS